MRALLLSGGLDSSAIAWQERPDLCVTIDYGQRAAKGERTAASALCKAMRLKHRILTVDLSVFGTGAMVGRRASKDAVSPEFWPYRNQMLLTLAAMLLQPKGLSEILIGAVSTDVHADGRPPFLRAIDRVMRIQEGKVRVRAPGSSLNSTMLLRRSGFPYRLVGLTFSCHLHDYACGQCNGCKKHRDVVRRAYAEVS